MERKSKRAMDTEEREVKRLTWNSFHSRRRSMGGVFERFREYLYLFKSVYTLEMPLFQAG